MVNVDEDVLTDDAPDGVCELDGGPSLAPEPLRRLGCDASTVVLIRRKDGNVAHRHEQDAEHPAAGAPHAAARPGMPVPRMWAAGVRRCAPHPPSGARRSNELENLVELCWFHHRLVHEGGWRLRLDRDGKVVVTNPVGNVIPSLRPPCRVAIEHRNRAAGIVIDATTVMPPWYGDPLDLGHITTALWCVDQRDRPSRN